MKVSKSIFVKRPVEAAFRHFTADMGKWWPLKEGFSREPARAHEIVLECRAGGSFYERYGDGVIAPIGRVTAFEPPARVAFTWRQGVWTVDTLVEVRFAAEGDGTRVTLEHTGWEALGERAAELSGRYAGGWQTILERYAA